MYVIRQLLRQPFKTLVGIIVILLAVSILCVCAGQAVVARHTEELIEHSYSTIALPTAKYKYVPEGESPYTGFYTSEYYLANLPAEVETWIQDTLSENTHLLEMIALPGLTSAYIPELSPENYTSHLDRSYHVNFNPRWYASKCPSPIGAPYSCAMLEITLDNVGEARNIAANINDDGSLSEITYIHTEVPITGVVSRVIGLQEGFRDPTGATVRLTLQVPDWDSWEQMELVAGERYLVYGMDYQDLDWVLRSKIAVESDYEIEIDAFDLEKMQWTDEDIVAKAKEAGQASYTIGLYHHEDHWLVIDNHEIEQFQSSSMSIVDKGVAPAYWKYITKSDGSVQFETITDRAYVNESGETVTVSLEEYAERYSVPTIVHLEGTAEEFLISEEGTPWREALENLQINNHAFPIIGVDKLGYIAEFARENARIVEGRDFTQDELDMGAKVCVISETLASANGLAVGDTISVQYYNGDRSLPYQTALESGYGTTNPTADFYFSTTPFTGDPEAYTIVGLYRQNNAWGDVSENLYAFTPNTIFTPKASVTGNMAYSDQAFFRTIVLKNGALSEFMDIVDSAGYEGLFVYYDQGYSVVAENLQNYQAVANRAMVVGIAVYGIALVLFLILFPNSQRRTLMVMEALGAGRGKKIQHLLTYSLGILIPGTIIGTILGMTLWQNVVDVLMTSAGATLSIQMNPTILGAIAVAQLGIAFCMILIAAIVMTRPKSLMTNG